MAEFVYIDSKVFEKIKEDNKKLQDENLEYKRRYRNSFNDSCTYKKKIKQLEKNIDELKREKEDLKQKIELQNKALFDAYEQIGGNINGIQLATNTTSLIEEVKNLRCASKEKDEIIEKFEKEKAKRKLRGNKKITEAIRDLVSEMITYAEKFPPKQNARALTLKEVLSTKMVNMHIPLDVLNDELLARLNNLGLKPITHIEKNYEAGATHNDHSKHFNLGNEIDPNKLLE